MSTLIAETDIMTIQYHFMNTLILSVVGALSSDLSTPLKNMTLHVSGGKVLPSRQELCIQNTNMVLGQIVGRFYVLTKFSQAAKDSMDIMVSSLRKSLEQSIMQLEFFDDVTRTVALDKLHKIVQKIGYGTSSPDVMSPASLDAYYQSVAAMPELFFENYISYRQWSARKTWELHGQKVDKQVWQLHPYQVNAYYNPLANEIVFPAGILQPPFYNVLNSENLNFGGIGAVIGHELTHGFDTSGRLFDGDGKIRSWWTKETERKYLERAQCFIDQYSNFTINGPENTSLHLNGDFESGEILADNGGLQISYNAWQNSLKDSKRTGIKYQNLETIGGYTAEQLFFIGFGQVWCSKVRPEYAAMRMINDPHPPPQWRVNGAIQNSIEFAKAFNCPTGTSMNPEKKCRVW
ncbi:hypothetical protein BC943DRAFT_308442 [Umbelopsis sp. AD052]|nr:hypothetical protein BC943DRAFT_308442 [Umbelopsis sp. AD052]